MKAQHFQSCHILKHEQSWKSVQGTVGESTWTQTSSFIARKSRTQDKMLKRNQLTTANCSQMTGERLASSVASQGLVRLALKGREVSAAGGGFTGRLMGGGRRWEGGFSLHGALTT